MTDEAIVLSFKETTVNCNERADSLEIDVITSRQ